MGPVKRLPEWVKRLHGPVKRLREVVKCLGGAIKRLSPFVKRFVSAFLRLGRCALRKAGPQPVVEPNPLAKARRPPTLDLVERFKDQNRPARGCRPPRKVEGRPWVEKCRPTNGWALPAWERIAPTAEMCGARAVWRRQRNRPARRPPAARPRGPGLRADRVLRSRPIPASLRLHGAAV